MQRKTRAELPREATWNLDDMFPTPEAWEAELDSILGDLNAVAAYKGRLSEGAGTLLACLQAEEALRARAIRMYTYASLRNSEDGTNPVNQVNSERASDAFTQMNAALSFIQSEILELPDGTVERFVQEEPGLEVYSRSLKELLVYKPHRLSPETEQVLASLGEVLGAPYSIYLRSKLTDMTFAPVQDDSGKEWPMSFTLYERKYELSPDTSLRRAANRSFVNTLKVYQNTFATVYATEVKKQVAMSRLRGFESVEHMLLQPQQVTKQMYNNILDIIQTELAPHMRRLANLKQRVLGLDKMQHCDLQIPLDPDYGPKVTYEEASRMVNEALNVLGPEYGKMVETAISQRWVDYMDNVGKSTGAFCSSPYGAHPFILMTWTDTMRGAFTLAHELGHAGHFYLAGRNQSYVNVRPSLYFIEAPSTLNELLLFDHIMAKAEEPRMRRWLIGQFLNTYYHNFVTHLLEAELQRRVYALAEKDQPITAKLLNEQKGELLTNFWGDAAEIDEGARLTWMRQPHYYKGLYPYTYAAGLSASTAVARQIREEGQPAVDRWLDVLKAGGSRTPLELMKMAGVDMSSPEPIRNAVAYVGSLIGELEKLYQ